MLTVGNASNIVIVIIESPLRADRPNLATVTFFGRTAADPTYIPNLDGRVIRTRYH